MFIYSQFCYRVNTYSRIKCITY